MFKGNGSLFTKPCELMMTDEKNEVSLGTQIFRIVAGVDFLRNSVTVEFPYPMSYSGFLSFFRLLYVQSLIINFAERTFYYYVVYLFSVNKFYQKYR